MTFDRPFHITEPLDPDHFAKGGLNAPTETTLLWTVEDADGRVISAHKTADAAITALAIAERTLP